MSPGARSKKPNITRSKNGCVSCRRKRRKCDEGTPSCRRCIDSGTICDYSTVLEFVDATGWAARRVKRDRAMKAASRQDQAEGRSVRRRATELMGRPPPASLKEKDPPQVYIDSQDELQDTDLVESIHQTADQASIGLDDQDAIPGPETLIPNPTPYLWQHTFDSLRPLHWQLENLKRCSQNFPTDLFPMPYDEQSSFFNVCESSLDHRHMTVDGNRDDRRKDTSHIDCIKSPDSQPDPHGAINFFNVAPDTISLASFPPTTPDSDASTTTSSLSQDTAISDISPLSSPRLETPIMERRSFTWWPSPRLALCAPLPIRDRQYLAHFQADVVDILPLRMDLFQEVAEDIAEVRSALMAVAAANLANRRGEYLANGPKAWQAQKRHLERATAFASDATTSTTKESNGGLPLGANILALLLLTCFSLEASTVCDIWQALGNLDKAILSRVDTVLQLPHGENLVHAWLRLRIMVSHSLRPHAPVLPESPLDAAVAEVAVRVSSSTSHAASLLGVNAVRISRRILASRSMARGQEHQGKTLSRLDSWWSVVRGEIPSVIEKPPLDEPDLFMALSGLGDQLDLLSPPPGFPPNFDPHATIQAPATQALSEPLHFSTHEDAMDAADFSFAKLACETELVRGLLDPSLAPMGTNPWFYLLLRIVAGLEPCSTVQQNKYRLGIAHHLANASLLCNDSCGLDVLSAYINSALVTESPCEDFFTPLPLALWGADVQRREMEQGRVVFFLASTFTAMAEKSGMYAKEPAECMMVFGREANGRYFNDVVPWYDSTAAGPKIGACF
ncbi:hypothetical protein B0T11DRAFT_9823 [Plectosphaerella cucumerina]|uniref:Zn(2)-C6 fungal-type domain-containing protein n=1 Tax=Plectosphaerella cucumerina TaxID=40658 RepID=A0A8K0TV24_9PEZI|nr:hypothetical protein B0T11DRAFT_9823 [Plectosphaerella cucumerina]